MKNLFNKYIRRLRELTDFEVCQDPYDGQRIVKLTFKQPYVRCVEVDLISFAIMRLLIKYAYRAGFQTGKFTIGYVIVVPTGEVSFTVTKRAISLSGSQGETGPNLNVFNSIMLAVMQAAENYEKEVISGIVLRIYYTVVIPHKETIISEEESDFQLRELITSGVVGGEPQAVKPMVVGNLKPIIPIM
jgi:hypothetical protein